MVHGVVSQFVTDVSGQYVGNIFEGQEVPEVPIQAAQRIIRAR